MRVLVVKCNTNPIYSTVVGYFERLFLDCITLNSGITDERCIKNDLAGSGCGIIEVLSHHFPGEAQENHGESQVTSSHVPAEIRTYYFPNTNVEC
jgi:hypothetical protein